MMPVVTSTWMVQIERCVLSLLPGMFFVNKFCISFDHLDSVLMNLTGLVDLAAD